MPPTLLLIRHAQALHNVASDWSIHDAPLSELGEQQCLELQESLKNSKIGNEVDLIVVSAMRRTLQTATIGLDWLIKKGVKVIPDAGWQETADKPCDTGSPLEQMKKEFPQYDFSSVDPSYPDKTTDLENNPYAFTQKAILARGQTCLEDLYSRPEKVIAVVSHSGFLRTAVCNRMFFNADWRVFNFDEGAMEKKPGQFILKESEETEKKGGGMGRSDVGVFGVVEGDFPPEVETEQAKEKGQVKELGEANKQKPSS
ncbi:phosphoglycerate mutase-like protein [Cucurbitaria berberidis CBS 394.84]|uniref:Phosphoglycerate mutase-like protein n=1 Tax=Cucurbitaria berberidis CBS 394.84 TaxID=1168544 RepID=A0A9P4L965_9PLEO|nr:phosphoglycerate mutase-like protein [Cucurbitaria berberidis CBS 394.84]KAF1845899.1 phosphoglycerate mutase-like protein [Cucurbitaria berberidis CBS 394.84]